MSVEEIIQEIEEVQRKYSNIKAVLAERQSRKLELEAECQELGFDPSALSNDIAVLKETQDKLLDQINTNLTKLKSCIEEYEKSDK